MFSDLTYIPRTAALIIHVYGPLRTALPSPATMGSRDAFLLKTYASTVNLNHRRCGDVLQTHLKKENYHKKVAKIRLLSALYYKFSFPK